MTGQSSGNDGSPYATHPALPEQEAGNPQLQDPSRGTEGFEPYVLFSFKGLLYMLIWVPMQDFIQTKTKTQVPFQLVKPLLEYRWRFEHRAWLLKTIRWTKWRCITIRASWIVWIGWGSQFQRWGPLRLVCGGPRPPSWLRRLYRYRLDLRVHKRTSAEKIIVFQWPGRFGLCAESHRSQQCLVCPYCDWYCGGNHCRSHRHRDILVGRSENWILYEGQWRWQVLSESKLLLLGSRW